jgi:PhnB protein
MARAAKHWQAAECGTVSAMIFVDEAEEVMAFAQSAFDAKVVSAPLRRQDGTLWHATLRIGDSTIMVSARPEGMPKTTAFLHVYVPDADKAYADAVSAGAQPAMPVDDQFYGDRAGGVTDLAGNVWWVSTHIETLDDAEIQRRAAAFEGTKG